MVNAIVYYLIIYYEFIVIMNYEFIVIMNYEFIVIMNYLFSLCVICFNHYLLFVITVSTLIDVFMITAMVDEFILIID